MVYTNENDYFLIRDQKTFAFSAENPTGTRSGGSQSVGIFVAYWYQTLPSAPLKPLPSDNEMIMK